MGSEKYKLKWSKYESNVLNAFRDLFETEALSDVTLFCEGEKFEQNYDFEFDSTLFYFVFVFEQKNVTLDQAKDIFEVKVLIR